MRHGRHGEKDDVFTEDDMRLGSTCSFVITVCKEPPYKVSETGYGSFNLPVEVYFRNKEEPRKYRLEYDLTLQLVGMPPYNFTKVRLM